MTKEDAKKIKYLILDVDGTLTDSGVIYDDGGRESKRFSTKDGTGFNIAHEAGMEIVVMTGRESEVTLRRMDELHTDYIFQNVQKKAEYLSEFMKAKNISSSEVAYVGDDINDYAAMTLCGFVGCPKDAAEEIKAIADYVSDVKAGYGAVRNVVEEILRIRGDREEVMKRLILKYAGDIEVKL